MRAWRDTAGDLDVQRRFAVKQARVCEKMLSDLVEDVTADDVGCVDPKLAKPEREPGKVTVCLEQTTVHCAPHFVDAIAKDESAIFHRNHRGGARKILAVEICVHGVAAGSGLEWKVMVAAEDVTG
jgi:hypothetical protein